MAVVVAFAILFVLVGGLAWGIIAPFVIARREGRRDRRVITAEGGGAEGHVTAISAADSCGNLTVKFEFAPGSASVNVSAFQQTTAAAAALLHLGVGSAVKVRYRPKHPTIAFIDALVRAERFGTRTSALCASEDALYYVSFVGVPRQSFDWSSRRNASWNGPGDIGFQENLLRIVAGRPRAFRTPKRTTTEIPLAEVCNVEVYGEIVSFEFTEQGAARRSVKFRAVDAREAAAIVARLPTTTTVGYAPVMAEAAEFAQALRALGPGTPVTWTLVGLNVAAFIFTATQGAGVFTADADVLVRLGSDYTPLTVGGEWWRLLTSTFLHFGFMHLALNMLALAVNGRVAEQLFGRARYVLIYVSAGLAGSVASLCWHTVVNGAGASGAIFGVFGALLAFFVRDAGGVPASVKKAQRTSIAAFIVYNVLNGARLQGIDNAAHLGGLATGFLLGLLLTRPLGAARTARSWSGQWWRACAIVGAAALIVGTLLEGGQLHPRVALDDQGHPIPLAAFGPWRHTFGRLSLGLTREQVEAVGGAPVRRVAPDDWLFNSVDSGHDGLLDAFFTPPADGKASVTYALLYSGDRASAPADLPYLGDLSLPDLVSRYGEPIGGGPPQSEPRYVLFRTGVFVEIVRGHVRRYGIAQSR